MTYLEVSKPLRPYKFGNSDKSRLVYRVITGNGAMTLPELAKKLDVPYASLAARVHKELVIGRHTDAFFAILADVKRRSRAATNPKSVRCPHCKGTGRMLLSRLKPGGPSPTGDALAVDKMEMAIALGDKAAAQEIFNAGVHRGIKRNTSEATS